MQRAERTKADSVQTPYLQCFSPVLKDLRGKLVPKKGFEPPMALRLCLIPSQVHSAGHRTTMEQDGVSTKTGMQRLHPLQRTTWTRLRDGTGIAQAAPFQILGKQSMKTSDAGR